MIYMTTEKEIDFLNENFLWEILNSVLEIQRRVIVCEIQKSDRVFSKTLYINFFIPQFYINPTNHIKKIKRFTLRISDHKLTKCQHPQFVIKPEAKLTKDRKNQLKNAIHGAIKKAMQKDYYKKLKNISKY